MIIRNVLISEYATLQMSYASARKKVWLLVLIVAVLVAVVTLACVLGGINV